MNILGLISYLWVLFLNFFDFGKVIPDSWLFMYN